jgi:hypothetical protein
MFLDLLLDTLIAFRELGRKITYLHQKRLNSPKNSAENPTFRQSPFSGALFQKSNLFHNSVACFKSQRLLLCHSLAIT